jgi:predicted DNA-binding protein
MGPRPTNPKKAQRAIGFRVDKELYEEIATAARRKNTTPSDYCRELVSAHLRKPREEETTAGVYRVALETLEDVVSLKGSIFRVLLTLFHT